MTQYHVYKVNNSGDDVIIAAPTSLEAARKIAKIETAKGVVCYVL